MNLPARDPDPLLLPPREKPYLLKDVLERVVHGCRDVLILDLGDCFLRFEIDPDTDTIAGLFQPVPFREREGYTSAAATQPWKQYIGKDCGGTWFGWNQEDYLDIVVVSFDGIEPSVLLHTMGSTIEVFTITRAGDASPAVTRGKKKSVRNSRRPRDAKA